MNAGGNRQAEPGARQGHKLIRPRAPVAGSPLDSRAVLLREIRLRAPVSRIELSKQTGISKPAVTRGIAALIDEGLVFEGERGNASSQGGRRPTLLELDPSAAAGIGCMIKVGELVAAISGFDGEIEHREAAPFDALSDPEAVLDHLTELLRSMIARNVGERPVVGCGVSVPGLVDEVGRVLATPHMPGWRDLELAPALEQRLEIPVYLDNESRVQAVAEAWYGHGRGIDNFVCLEAGVGLSAGVVINGELWRGTHSLAGEIGHTSISEGGERCYCDDRGCWEMSASITHVVNSVRTSSIARSDRALYQDADLTMDSVVAAARGGDPVAAREIEAHADVLARGLCNLILAYDPERVILHGESILLGDELIEMLRDRVADRFRIWLDYDAPIMLTDLGTEAALKGALSLALHGAWGFWDPTAGRGAKLT